MNKFLLLDEECNSHYDLEIEENKLKLFHSKYGGWAEACRGKLASSLDDSGNGVSIKIGKKKMTIDYSEIEELMVLLVAYKAVINPSKAFKIVSLKDDE